MIVVWFTVLLWITGLTTMVRVWRTGNGNPRRMMMVSVGCTMVLVLLAGTLMRTMRVAGWWLPKPFRYPPTLARVIAAIEPPTIIADLMVMNVGSMATCSPATTVRSPRR
jgi:hypothetical protein